MVTRLNDLGFDCYGFDLLENVPRWKNRDLPSDRLVIADSDKLVLPFHDGVFDLVYSFGVIEHVGTTNGHSNRKPDYHEIRKSWVREIFRTMTAGGSLLLAGPNRNFPIDLAHGLDARATAFEAWLSRQAGFSVHFTWGENFLWGYSDLRRYCQELPCRYRWAISAQANEFLPCAETSSTIS